MDEKLKVDTATAVSILRNLGCLCAELPFAGWLSPLRVSVIMLAGSRADANLALPTGHKIPASTGRQSQ
jgi:hypothetical protein